MYFFFDILKISSVIETLNSHETNKAVLVDDDGQKSGFSLVQDSLNFKLVRYFSGNKFRQTQFQLGQFFVFLDKKQYKTLLEITLISLLGLVNSNLEILLIRKTFIKNDVIKWLPAFHW